MNPSIELIEAVIGVDVDKVAEVGREKIPYMRTGDSLYSFIRKEDFTSRCKEYSFRNKLSIRTVKVPASVVDGPSWTAEALSYENDGMKSVFLETGCHTEFSAVVSIAQRVLESLK